MPVLFFGNHAPNVSVCVNLVLDNQMLIFAVDFNYAIQR